MHRYTTFHLEVQAVFNFLKGVGETFPYRKLIGWMPSDYWSSYNPTKFFNITDQEKVVFLRDMGFEFIDIGERLGFTKLTTKRRYTSFENKRHFRTDDKMDILIEQWNEFKIKFPKEIFIKYID